MAWLAVIISAFFILAIVYLADKYLLSGDISNPKVFAFYVGFLWFLAFFLIPFINFYLPNPGEIAISFFTGAVSIYALFWFYKTLRLSEASRVVPAIGGLIPLFTFAIIYILSFGKKSLSFLGGISFILLVLGSILITLPVNFFNFRGREIKKKLFSLNLRKIFYHYFLEKGNRELKYSVLTAFLFSLSFVSAKYVYLGQPFWNGFIWIRIGGFLTAIVFFILFPEIKKEILEEIFKEKKAFKRGTMAIFISSQSASAIAGILQNWAIALAPLAYVSIINALQGSQYLFLFVFTVILSLKFPHILKEEVSQRIIIQKIIAIFIIVTGIAILFFIQ